MGTHPPKPPPPYPQLLILGLKQSGGGSIATNLPAMEPMHCLASAGRCAVRSYRLRHECGDECHDQPSNINNDMDGSLAHSYRTDGGLSPPELSIRSSLRALYRDAAFSSVTPSAKDNAIARQPLSPSPESTTSSKKKPNRAGAIDPLMTGLAGVPVWRDGYQPAAPNYDNSAVYKALKRVKVWFKGKKMKEEKQVDEQAATEAGGGSR